MRIERYRVVLYRTTLGGIVSRLVLIQDTDYPPKEGWGTDGFLKQLPGWVLSECENVT